MQQKTKDIIYVSLFGAGLILIIIGLFVRDIPEKPVLSVLLRIGIVLFAVGFMSLVNRLVEKKSTDLAVQRGEALSEEHIMAVRHRAKSLASDISQWLLVGVAYLTILFGAPFWATLSIVGVFVVCKLLYLLLTLYYQKKL